MAIVGVGTFVSGAILRFNLLVLGGVVFWLGAFACTLTTPLNQLLINAIATFIGYIVPGVMLWKEYKKENNV
jgi:thiamine transporter ThiT